MCIIAGASAWEIENSAHCGRDIAQRKPSAPKMAQDEKRRGGAPGLAARPPRTTLAQDAQSLAGGLLGWGLVHSPEGSWAAHRAVYSIYTTPGLSCSTSTQTDAPLGFVCVPEYYTYSALSSTATANNRRHYQYRTNRPNTSPVLAEILAPVLAFHRRCQDGLWVLAEPVWAESCDMPVHHRHNIIYRPRSCTDPYTVYRELVDVCPLPMPPPTVLRPRYLPRTQSTDGCSQPALLQPAVALHMWNCVTTSHYSSFSGGLVFFSMFLRLYFSLTNPPISNPHSPILPFLK